MILYQIWCKRTYVSSGFCEGEDEPTQLIFTTLDKARSKNQKTIIVKKMVNVNITLKRLKFNKSGGIVMVDVSNQHWNEDGSITIILNSIEEVEEFVECVNIWNKMCEDEE